MLRLVIFSQLSNNRGMKLLQKGGATIITIIICIIILLGALGVFLYVIKTSPVPSDDMSMSTSSAKYIPRYGQPNVGVLHIQAKVPQGSNPTAYGVKIYYNNTVVNSVKFTADGTIDINIPAGNYIVYPDYYVPGKASSDVWTSNLPQSVTVPSKDVASLNVTITTTR